MTTPTQETQSDKERERRRKRYKMALIKYVGMYDGDGETFAVVSKDHLGFWWTREHEVICDDQPARVLYAMLRMKEK